MAPQKGSRNITLICNANCFQSKKLTCNILNNILYYLFQINYVRRTQRRNTGRRNKTCKMTLTSAEVEEWLEGNHDWTQEYVLRKLDMNMINKWLMLHGFNTIQDYITVRRGSLSQESSGHTSPDPRSNDNGAHFFSDSFQLRQRSNSKKFLRHDFAKAKLKKNFRTCEVTGNSDYTLEQRRSSLKGMRQFLSLPPTSVNLLSMLISSKTRLPRYTSIDEELKRQLRMTNERDFFLEIVKDISHDLDLKSLTTSILMNIGILLDADRASLFFVEGTKGKQSLVSKVFDVYTGTNCIPTTQGDNIVRVPWGQGIIGHVAATGEPVNITRASQVNTLLISKQYNLSCIIYVT